MGYKNKALQRETTKIRVRRWRALQRGLPLDIARPAIAQPAIAQSIYFIADDEANTIKIGRAASPQERLETLQTGNSHKLRLVKIIEGGGYELEYQLQTQFNSHHLNGEWFAFVEDIKVFLNQGVTGVTPRRGVLKMGFEQPRQAGRVDADNNPIPDD